MIQTGPENINARISGGAKFTQIPVLEIGSRYAPDAAEVRLHKLGPPALREDRIRGSSRLAPNSMQGCCAL